MSSLDDSKYGKINQREFKKALQETLEDNGLHQLDDQHLNEIVSGLFVNDQGNQVATVSRKSIREGLN